MNRSSPGRGDRRVSGIGYELAWQFARNGFDLIIVAEEAGLGGRSGAGADRRCPVSVAARGGEGVRGKCRR